LTEIEIRKTITHQAKKPMTVLAIFEITGYL